ncbi:MAG: HAMP domain-containing protein [Deltaproteobacteria bacterium]|nr:HAMP domain-containing protein [Deltaproteobacteria bacterium]
MRIRLTLFPKLLIAFLLLSLFPLLWAVVDAARRIQDVGRQAVEHSTRVLDAKASRALELQAGALAGEIARFLEERVQDVRILAELPAAPDVLLAFSRARTGTLWVRAPTGGPGPRTQLLEAPLYSELAWIDAAGREVLRVEGSRVVPRPELRDVSRPGGTSFGAETYYRELLRLPPGQAYVGHVVGRHVSKTDQLAGAATVEEAVGGAQFRGHVRFGLARWSRGRFAGAVVAALDHRHLMEFTQHVLPLSRERVIFPSYLSGNYAFLFDDEGWIITHPKFWDIRGVDREGRWLLPYTQSSSRQDIASGRIPFRLDAAGFVHPSYPLVARAVRSGRSGVTRTFNVSGVDKVMAYAPIRFRHGEYAGSGIFGGVTIGARTDAFHREAEATGRVIEEGAHRTLRTGLGLAWALARLALAASFGLSRTIASPIRTVRRMAGRIAGGELSARVDVRSSDEVGDLAADFNRMAELLEDKEARLTRTLRDLGYSRDDAHAYAARIEEQLRILKHIHSISEVLGTTFDREEVLSIILRTCVEGLGFDRAFIHVLDPEEKALRCLGLEGFDAEESARLRARPLPLSDASSALVRVVLERRPIHVAHPDAEEVTGFAYVPMKIRDRVVGALGAGFASPEQAMPDNLAGALQIVAGQAARAIERARLFEAANRERSFVEAVIASISSGLMTLDASGRVLTINPYAQTALGTGDASGRKLSEANVDPALCAWTEQLMAADELAPGEFELSTPEGRRTFAWVPSRFERDEGPGLILQFRDVTAEKTLRRALERVDRLASLGRLAAGVAHEIRNPLTGMSLLLDDLHDRLDSGADRMLVARALQEIERLEGIVQNLLDYAQVGSLEKEKKPVSLAHLVEESLFLIQKSARSQGTRVEVEVSPDTPVVPAEAGKLKQALLNFYLNALQAMPEGGVLRVSAGPVPGGALVRVSDTGHGIPESEREKIFEPFYTLRPGGSGLGLSIAQTIILDHGGQIEIDSEVDRGSELRVFLSDGSTPVERPNPAA